MMLQKKIKFAHFLLFIVDIVTIHMHGDEREHIHNANKIRKLEENALNKIRCTEHFGVS